MSTPTLVFLLLLAAYFAGAWLFYRAEYRAYRRMHPNATRQDWERHMEQKEDGLLP